MKDTSARYAMLNSESCQQVGFSTPPVLQSYFYSPMYSYSSPCSKTNYYSSCGNCPKKISVTDAYSNDMIGLRQQQGGGCPNYSDNSLYNVREYDNGGRENMSLQKNVKGPLNVRLRSGCGCGK